ncbi:MAG: 50S ribosomal protein L17 [Planctomycetes bacterium]|nr:50S ribosomal protein L17 [Planctomycetota bacterium]
MRHLKSTKRLGRDTQHRVALRRNMAASLILDENEKVITTPQKAKHLRRFVEKLITLGKRNRAKDDTPREKAKQLSGFRQAVSLLQNEKAAKKIFGELAQRYENRPGGYTRILRMDKRRLGDAAEQVLFALIPADEPLLFKKGAPSSKPAPKTKEPATKEEPAQDAPEETPVAEATKAEEAPAEEATSEETPAESTKDALVETPAENAEDKPAEGDSDEKKPG